MSHGARHRQSPELRIIGTRAALQTKARTGFGVEGHHYSLLAPQSTSMTGPRATALLALFVHRPRVLPRVQMRTQASIVTLAALHTLMARLWRSTAKRNGALVVLRRGRAYVASHRGMPGYIRTRVGGSGRQWDSGWVRCLQHVHENKGAAWRAGLTALSGCGGLELSGRGGPCDATRKLRRCGALRTRA